MDLLAFILTQLLAAYTVLVEPFVRTNFYRMLKKQLKVDPNARLLYYRTQVLWEWSWVVVLVLIFIPIPQPFQRLGITLPSIYGWIILLALLLGIGLSVFLIRRNPASMEAMQRGLEKSSALLPNTPEERKWYALNAITMGICEELLYRGFLIYYIHILLPGVDWILVAIIQGIIYGLSRAYLGGRGVLLNVLNGFSYGIIFFLSGNLLATFGQPVALTGSVIPVMIFHVMSELRNLWLWQPALARKSK